MTNRAAVLFRTHFWDEFVQRQFDRLLTVVQGTDVFVLVDETAGRVIGIPHDNVFAVTEASLLAMGLARAGHGNLLWFNGDYPLYAFAARHPGYDYYFQLEYDVVITNGIAELIDDAAARHADFVGLTKGEPFDAWFWRDSCAGVYDGTAARHQLICLSLFSARALRHLLDRRLSMSRAHADGRLQAWPYCEAFVPTELVAAGMVCLELDGFGGTAAYDHWPPYLESDLPALRAEGFIHPVLDKPRYIASLLKYHVGLKGYLNPTSLFHRKLRRLTPRDYLVALATSFVGKVARSLGQGRRQSA